MLTAYQAQTAAFLVDGAAYCVDCEPWDATPDDAVCRYTLESEWPEGLWCDGCFHVIVDPDPEYCQEHDMWADTVLDRDSIDFGEHYFPCGCKYPAGGEV